MPAGFPKKGGVEQAVGAGEQQWPGDNVRHRVPSWGGPSEGGGVVGSCHRCTLNLATGFCRVSSCMRVFIIFPVGNTWFFFPHGKAPRSPAACTALGRARHLGYLLCLSPRLGTSKDEALAKGVFFLSFLSPPVEVAHGKPGSTHSPGAAPRLCWSLGRGMVAVAALSLPSVSSTPCLTG